MSILIRGAEMPKETTAFVFSKNGKVSRFSVGASKDRMFEAVEIQTPHGRLIDADDFLNKLVVEIGMAKDLIDDEFCRKIAEKLIESLIKDVGNQPTIVEAEEET